MENSALGLAGNVNRSDIKEEINNLRTLIDMVRDMNISLDEIFEHCSKNSGKTAKDVEREIRGSFATFMLEQVDLFEKLEKIFEE
jgi:uncharacterized protein YoxC